MRKTRYNSLLIFSACFLVFLFAGKISRADTAVDCNDLSGDAQTTCEALEKKAQAYQDIIKLKNKQQTILSTQLDSINQQQKLTLQQMQDAQKKVTSIGDQIQDLERGIGEKELQIEGQRKILSGLMQTYYDYDQEGILNLVLKDEASPDPLIQTDYIEQSGEKVTNVLADISRSRQELVDNQTTLTSKRDELNQTKDDLSNKKDDLESTENQKTNLLSQTQGEEVKYKQLLARVEAQKADLFDFSAASNAGSLSDSVNSYAKPSDNLASTSWYFSQKDSRWGNNKIGNSNSLMKDYGCAVTALSMVLRKNGSSIDPGKMAKQKVFYYDLIKWPVTWEPSVSLISSISHGNINWSKIDAEIKKGNPVIVYIGRSRGGGHYVVVTGKDKKDYIVHDPYFGPNLYLSTSKALVGKLGTDSGVSVNQMIIYE